MNKLFIFLLMIFSAGLSAQDWTTDYEKSEFKKTPGYDETIDFCNRLCAASPIASMTNLGQSPQGRAIPMMIIDRDGLTSPEAIRAKGRVITLIQACIHPGNPMEKMLCWFCSAIC